MITINLIESRWSKYHLIHGNCKTIEDALTVPVQKQDNHL